MNTTNEESDDWGHHAEVPEDENATTSFLPIDENNNENDASSTTCTTADDLRKMANGYYANKDFDSALPLYTAALETFEMEQQQKNEERGERKREEEETALFLEYVDLKVIYLCNRATCLYRMEMYEESRADALEAVNVSSGK